MKEYKFTPGLSTKKANCVGIYRVMNISIRDDEIRLVKFIGRLVCFRKRSSRVVLRNKIRRQRLKFGFSLSSPALLSIKKFH